MFLIYPALRDVKNISKEIFLSKSKVISLNEQNMELNNFKKKYNNYSYNLEKVDQLFVDSKDPVNFIEFLEKTANDSGIGTDVKLDISLSKEGFNNLPVAISSIYGTGQFLNILKFSEKLDASPYLMRIKDLTIKKSPQEPTVDFNFLVEAVTK
ncbi:MAG: type 4a pilus biogenesis protein PilO [Candidatus Staskawiczbacteria bacterium]|nr:type 4a pilus biogenesis protein PilO [Candidatus Staskawiczbacteria bacterium]